MSTPHENDELPQEEDRVSRIHVIGAMVIVLFISAVMVVWAWATTAQVTATLRPTGDFYEERLQPSASPPQANELLFGQPGLGERLNAVEAQALTTYRWIDRRRGIVTLPIEEAMDRIARESKP